MNNLSGRGIFSSAQPPFCPRTLLWLALSVVRYPQLAYARPTSEVLRRASDNNGVGSNGNGVSANVWVRIVHHRAPTPKPCSSYIINYPDTRTDSCSRRRCADTDCMRQAGHTQRSQRRRCDENFEHTCWSGSLSSPWKAPEARTDTKSDFHKIASTLHAGTGRPGACYLQV